MCVRARAQVREHICCICVLVYLRDVYLREESMVCSKRPIFTRPLTISARRSLSASVSISITSRTSCAWKECVLDAASTAYDNV